MLKAFAAKPHVDCKNVIYSLKLNRIAERDVKPLPKKEFTSFDTSAVVHELNEALANSRVNNVYQLDAKTLLLKLRKTDAPPLRLVMEAGRRLHLTSYTLRFAWHLGNTCGARGLQAWSSTSLNA
jgi:hypothetical protein